MLVPIVASPQLPGIPFVLGIGANTRCESAATATADAQKQRRGRADCSCPDFRVPSRGRTGKVCIHMANPDSRQHDIAKAKAILKEAGRYLDLRDADRAAQLLEQAAQIVTELANETGPPRETAQDG